MSMSLPKIKMADAVVKQPVRHRPFLPLDAHALPARRSPALDLQESLGRALNNEGVDHHPLRPVPLGYTILGLVAFCGLVWAGIAALFQL